MEQRYTETTDLFLEEPVIYGGFWERFGAALIDGIIIGIGGYVISLILPPAPGQYIGVANFLNLIIGWLYFALQESSVQQATIGKKALGLKVTSVNGERISFGQATGRHFGKWVSTVIIFIGYFMMLWDTKKQTLHDKMANTLVVKS